MGDDMEVGVLHAAGSCQISAVGMDFAQAGGAQQAVGLGG